MNIPNPTKYNELLARVAYLRERVDKTLETRPELWDSNHYLTPEAVKSLKDWVNGEHYWTFNHWTAYSPDEIAAAYGAIVERIEKLGTPPQQRNEDASVGSRDGDEEDGDEEW
jgi:uncharacterized Fe-S radical SAM superfamily protein PflX